MFPHRNTGVPTAERPDALAEQTPENIHADIAKVRQALAMIDKAVTILSTVDYLPPSLIDALRLIEPTSYKRTRVEHALEARERDAEKIRSDRF